MTKLNSTRLTLWKVDKVDRVALACTHWQQSRSTVLATESTELVTMSTATSCRIQAVAESSPKPAMKSTVSHGVGNKVDHVSNKVDCISDSRLCCRFVAGVGNSQLCCQCVLGFKRVRRAIGSVWVRTLPFGSDGIRSTG